MKLSLVVLAAGKQAGKVLEIKVPQFVIGRDPECQLRPASPMISKRHCALIQKDGKVYIKDYGSTNGSFVNDQPVQNTAAQLKNGDQLKIGPLLFEVRLETDEAAVKPPQPTAKPGQPAAKAPPAKVGATAKSAPSPRPPDSDSSADDDIAAMLLSGTDDETVSDGPAAQDIPQGTTIFEIPIPNPQTGEPGKPPEKEKPKEPPKGSNSDMAAAILEKLRKRPRTQQ
jgi:predicted component of type VI protein secretion system